MNFRIADLGRGVVEEADSAAGHIVSGDYAICSSNELHACKHALVMSLDVTFFQLLAEHLGDSGHVLLARQRVLLERERQRGVDEAGGDGLPIEFD